MKHFPRSLLAAAVLWSSAGQAAPAAPSPKQASRLEVVAVSDVRPGNVAVSAQGRVFATFHPLGGSKVQLGEVKDGRLQPYPDLSVQNGGAAASDATFDTPLGVSVDSSGRLWVIDMGLKLGKTRLWAFDLNTNRLARKIELPADIAPKGSFVQDFAIDEARGWAYLADIANPGIIALDLASGKARRFGGHRALQSEDIDMKIDGRLVHFGGKPARVGINPITLSADRETLYFGAMNGTTWYRLPAKLLREGADDAAIAAAIAPAGPKPISDGVATSAVGDHYFTDLQRHAIARLGRDGKLSEVLRDPRLQWPDNLALGPDGWIYVSVNQLDRTPSFTGGADEGRPPYHLYRFRAR
ncbi:L-dopachrome tautomerase-related protein [Lysobacter sp. CA199]|uniref:L-dopachrome tautomerase-related protein n=1 Tax=Lysobacter sp. CA199 TaxID=3455608 RepID=UPI003F8D1C27